MSLAAASANASKPNYSVENARQRMQQLSIMETASLAQRARRKLFKETAKADHDLRLLVGHVSMLSFLTIDLANAEQEQKRRSKGSLPGARDDEEPKHEHIETICGGS